jgi:hypothetical protein
VPNLTHPIDTDGALVDIEVGWARSRARAARQAGRPIPPAIQVRALIDTGAETSCLHSTYVQQLDLPLGGLVMANVPALGGPTFASEHDASLTVLHPSGNPRLNLVLFDVLVLDLDLGALGYQALLGRDMLAWCRLLYDGPAGRFKLRY